MNWIDARESLIPLAADTLMYVYRTVSIKEKIFLATQLHPTLSDNLWDELAVASLHSAGLVPAMLELAQ
jgi:hypothetical protein